MPIITITEESLDLVDIQTLCPLEGEVEDAPITSTATVTATTAAATTSTTAPLTTASTAVATSAPTAATGFASYFPSFMLPSSSTSSSSSTTPIIPPPSTSTIPSTAVTIVGTSTQQQHQKQQRLTKTAKTKRLTQFQSFFTQLTRLDETLLINYQTQLHPDYTATTYSSTTNTTTTNNSSCSHAVACILISYIKHKRIQTLFDQLPMHNTTNTATTAPITGTLPNSYLIPADVAPLVPPTLVTYLRSSEVHSIRLQAEQSGIVKARAYAERIHQVLNRCGLGGVISLTPTGIIYMCMCIGYFICVNVYKVGALCIYMVYVYC